SWYRENRVRIFYGANVLALQHNQNLVVSLGVVVASARLEVKSMDAAAHRAIAARRIEAGGHRLLRLGPTIDHRHDDTVSAVVEHALDMIVTVSRDTGERDGSGVGDGGEHVRGRLPIDQAVLQVDRQPSESGPGHESRRRDAAER